MKTVLAALSLKDGANEAEALSAVNRIFGERAQLLAATGKDSIAEAIGVLASWKIAADEVVVLKAEATKKAAEQSEKDFDAEVANAKKSGVLAASDEHKRNKAALAFKGKPDALVSLRNFLGALDPLVPANSVTKSVEPAAHVAASVALTDEEKRIADKMGIKHEALLKNKQRLLVKAAQQPVKTEDDDKDAA